MVYLINGVIYKVNIDHSADWNVLEYEQARTLRPLLPQGVFIPEVSLFEIDGNSVIAMEFIDGDISGECDGMFDDEPCACDSPCMPDDLLTELRSIGWDDNTMGNAVCCDGVYYLIDLGC